VNDSDVVAGSSGQPATAAVWRVSGTSISYTDLGTIPQHLRVQPLPATRNKRSELREGWCQRAGSQWAVSPGGQATSASVAAAKPPPLKGVLRLLCPPRRLTTAPAPSQSAQPASIRSTSRASSSSSRQDNSAWLRLGFPHQRSSCSGNITACQSKSPPPPTTAPNTPTRRRPTNN
jgi:hypothetical protein